jgi:hypothetical protein
VNYPAGRWMLADLGISRIKKSNLRSSTSGDLIGEVTPTAIRRVPGKRIQDTNSARSSSS